MEAFDQHDQKMAGLDKEVKHSRSIINRRDRTGDLMPKTQTIYGDKLDLGAF
jgi:hypothetical protein